MLLQIDGWFGGGKSALRSLLDGHKDIFVNHVHDYSFSLLLDKSNDDEWIQKKHTSALRKILSQSEYYKFEKLYHEKVLEIYYSADIFEAKKFKLNFYEFDKLFFNRLMKLDKWTINNIIDTLYKSYYDIYNNYPSKYPKYFASMSHPERFRFYKDMPNLLPNSKSILVKRNLLGIIATRMNRRERPQDLNEYQAFRTPLNKILETREIEKILNCFETYDELIKLYPTNFYVVNFENLITNPKEEMKKIAKFLEIEYDDILSIPTMDGELLKYKGLSFIGEENDKYEDLLTPKEIEIIKHRENLYHKKNINVQDTNFSNNFEFNRKFNHLLIDLDVIKRKFNNIILYGNSFLSKTIQNYLEDKVINVISDMEQLKSINNFDAILITELGNEKNIYTKLVTEYEIPGNKIIFINI